MASKSALSEKRLDGMLFGAHASHVPTLVEAVRRQRHKLVYHEAAIAELEAQNSQQRKEIITLRARVADLESEAARKKDNV